MQITLPILVCLLALSASHDNGVGAVATDDPRFQVRAVASDLGRSQSAIAPGSTGFGTDLFVTFMEERIIRLIDSNLEMRDFADLRGVIPEGSFLTFPTFDAFGNYGGGLFVADDHVGTTSPLPQHIYAIDAMGGITAFAGFNAPWDNDVLAFDPYGEFGGSLFLTEGISQSLLRIDTSGIQEPFATPLHLHTRAAAFSSGGSFGNAIYVTDTVGQIHRVLPDGTVSPWLEIDGIPTGLAIGSGGAFGAEVMYIAEAFTGEVLMLAPDGTELGRFLSGLSSNFGAGADLYFSSDGTRMFVHDVEPGNIWEITVVPEPPALLFTGLGLGILLAARNFNRRQRSNSQ